MREPLFVERLLEEPTDRRARMNETGLLRDVEPLERHPPSTAHAATVGVAARRGGEGDVSFSVPALRMT